MNQCVSHINCYAEEPRSRAGFEGVDSNRYPASEIVWFEDAGHMLPIEEPEQIVGALLGFLDRRVA